MTKKAEVKKKREKKKKLTIKEKNFAKQIIIQNGNATAAAKAAGYSAKAATSIASENLRKPHIQEAVAREAQTAAEKLGITPEYVLNNFKEIVDFNKQKRIKAKQIGGETFNEEEMIDANAAIRSNEMLGKHLKLFVDKIELEAQVEDISDKESKIELAKQIVLALQNPEQLLKN